MKKIIYILIFCLFFQANAVLATNTKSLDLESTSSQIAQANDSVSLSVTGDLTIQFYVKPESLPATQYRIIDKTNYDSNQDSYSIYVMSTGVMGFSSSDDGAYTDGIFWSSTGAAVSAGSWQHFALVVDVSASSVTVYKDTSSIAGTSSGSATSIFDGNSKLTIGAQAWDAPFRFFDGLIDDVRIYNIARTQAAISADYQTEVSCSSTGLVAYWKMNDAVTDCTSNANNLTLVNSPVYSSDVPFVDAPAAVEPRKSSDIINFGEN